MSPVIGYSCNTLQIKQQDVAACCWSVDQLKNSTHFCPLSCFSVTNELHDHQKLTCWYIRPLWSPPVTLCTLQCRDSNFRQDYCLTNSHIVAYALPPHLISSSGVCSTLGGERRLLQSRFVVDPPKRSSLHDLMNGFSLDRRTACVHLQYYSFYLFILRLLFVFSGCKREFPCSTYFSGCKWRMCTFFLRKACWKSVLNVKQSLLSCFSSVINHLIISICLHSFANSFEELGALFIPCQTFALTFQQQLGSGCCDPFCASKNANSHH